MKIQELVHEYAVTDVTTLKFSDEIIDYCRANLCGNFEKSWCCPPAVISPETKREQCKKYDKMLVFSTLHKLEDSFDFEGMADAKIEHSKIESEVAKCFDGQKIEVIGAGACTLCKTCTYPTSPCRFPEKARAPMEAYGIDVVTLAKDCNIRYNNGVNTVTYFSVILYKNQKGVE